MISPTAGRIVWYHPAKTEMLAHALPYPTPLAAIVAYVWDDRMVNLTVFDANGAMHAKTSVKLVQDGDERPTGSYCEWMPFQKGQAAKAEQLEKAAAFARKEPMPLA